jgi:hypothetical protein
MFFESFKKWKIIISFNELGTKDTMKPVYASTNTDIKVAA